MTDKQFPLAAEFARADLAQWRRLVDAALKGADFEKRLVSKTYDGIRVEPLYPVAKDAKPVTGRGAQPWQVMARVDHPDPSQANKQALDDLENGATGLTLVFGGSAGAYGYGLDDARATIGRVLEGVYLEGAPIELELAAQHKDAGQALAAEIMARKIKPPDTQIRFGYDPLGAKARAGSSPLPAAQIDALFVDIIKSLQDQGFAGPFACADGRHVHAAGGSEAQELAFVIGNAVHYLRLFAAAGLKAAHRLIWFRLAADADEFLTIAKFRALRKMWSRVLEASGFPGDPAFVSAETAWRMMTRRDPYVNMLRTTVAVTAAGVGGADAIAVLPFTNAIGLPDGFARRVARNTHLVLLEESSLAKVADPAAGSGGIEALTQELARVAWALFQEIESAGGAASAIEQSLIQKKVAATLKARQDAIAKRKDALTGTSDYPNLGEQAVKVLDVKPVTAVPLPAAVRFDALQPIRLAAPYEELRDRADDIRKRTGARPKVFLATLGRMSDFTARATFAKNLYEAGGIEAPFGEGFKTTDDMIAAFKASGAKVACLCSSDKVYETQAAAAAQALKAAGAAVSLAGRPGEHESQYRAAGVESFIYAGCDAVAALRAAHDRLAS